MRGEGEKGAGGRGGARGRSCCAGCGQEYVGAEVYLGPHFFAARASLGTAGIRGGPVRARAISQLRGTQPLHLTGGTSRHSSQRRKEGRGQVWAHLGLVELFERQPQELADLDGHGRKMRGFGTSGQ